MKGSLSLPLHHCHSHKLWGALNRTYALLNFLALLPILYYRGAFFLNKNDPKYHLVPLLPWLIIFVAELTASFLWALKQPMYWWPVTRTAFPERLPRDDGLPGLDVFICTADPKKEPTFEVMNTVVSAMALDYPADKLNVYLSDDAGACVTLKGMKEAWAFSTWWLPFCKRYNVKAVCPMAYFEGPAERSENEGYTQEREKVKEKFEVFKQRVQRRGRTELDGDLKRSAKDHPSMIEVINENSILDDTTTRNTEFEEKMPLLVYVAREKRPSEPHNFKAGALNALLRVSTTLSNSPYILILDCDMYCNDSVSARQAMCFHLDPKVSSTLGWVQYPQKFHNVCESDVYDSQIIAAWLIYWRGLDSLQGPIISGTNFYIKREALYGVEISEGDVLKEMRNSFGHSKEFLSSLKQIYQPNTIKSRELSAALAQEAQILASCTYDKGTKWGEKVGFRYNVVEDILTGIHLQSKGWRAAYLNPTRPQFLGTATTNLHDMLTQGMRWYSGIISVGLSKYCPLINSPSRMQLLHKMSFSWICLFPLDFLPVWCFAVVPSLCYLYGIPLYPKVSDPFFLAFAIVFVSSRLKLLCEHTLIHKGSTISCLNEQRSWFLKSITCYSYGFIACVSTKLGFREATFNPTDKAEDVDKAKYYQMGKYDFRTSNMFLIPIVTVVSLNVACFLGGLVKVMVARNLEAMFGQVAYSFYVLVVCFPVIEGMLLRGDDGRVPLSATVISAAVSLVVLSLGYVVPLQ